MQIPHLKTYFEVTVTHGCGKMMIIVTAYIKWYCPNWYHILLQRSEQKHLGHHGRVKNKPIENG